MEYVVMERRHIPQIAALEKALFNDPWLEPALEPELENELALWLVALEGDAVAGYVGSQTVLGEADMMNLAVRPDYRRRGIAKRLVEELIARLPASSLTLEVRQSNAAAIALYEALGFRQVGLRKNYYRSPREHALILKKEW